MKRVMIFVGLLLVGLLSSSATAQTGSPWGDPNGPNPCEAAPDDAGAVCVNLFAIECRRYRNAWHACADDEDPAGCRQHAWSWYQTYLDAVKDSEYCSGVELSPEAREGVHAVFQFVDVVSEDNMRLLVDSLSAW